MLWLPSSCRVANSAMFIHVLSIISQKIMLFGCRMRENTDKNLQDRLQIEQLLEISRTDCGCDARINAPWFDLNQT